MTPPNPFVIDTPLPPAQLIDREDEWRELIGLADGGHNSRVSAPRRYGKTTLLRKVLVEAERLGMATVYVDLFGVLAIPEVMTRIEQAYYEGLKGPLARWFLGVRKKWRPSAGLRAPGADARLEPVEGDAPALLYDLLDLPKGVYERSGKRTLVVFDEFQDLLAAHDRLDGIFRSRIQHHTAEASYIFAGSHPGLMTELFSSRRRPLFGQARHVQLAPLPDGDLAEYIGRAFEETGRDATPSLESLLDLVRGHPQRAMFMAHHLWRLTPKGAAADAERWNGAFRAALVELQEAFERTWEDLSPNQRRALAAVTWIGPWGRGSSLYANDTLRRFNLAKGSAQHVLARLKRRGDLEETPDGTPRLVDPLFEAWIAGDRRPPAADEDGGG